jgi:hypothetical protein
VELIRPTVAVIGVTQLAIGVTLIFDHQTTRQLGYHDTMQLASPDHWAVAFLVMGAAVLAAAATWRTVLGTCAASSVLQGLWAVLFFATAVKYDGVGAIGSIVWTALAVLSWLAGARAVTIPDPRGATGGGR